MIFLVNRLRAILNGLTTVLKKPLTLFLTMSCDVLIGTLMISIPLYVDYTFAHWFQKYLPNPTGQEGVILNHILAMLIGIVGAVALILVTLLLGLIGEKSRRKYNNWMGNFSETVRRNSHQ